MAEDILFAMLASLQRFLAELDLGGDVAAAREDLDRRRAHVQSMIRAQLPLTSRPVTWVEAEPEPEAGGA